MKYVLCLIALLFLVSVGTARAQSGCDDSPECSTVVLAAVGAAGVFASRWLKK